MNTEELLHKYRTIDLEIERLKVEINEIRNDSGIRGIDYSRDKIQSNNTSSQVEVSFEIQELQIKSIEKKIKHLQSLKEKLVIFEKFLQYEYDLKDIFELQDENSILNLLHLEANKKDEEVDPLVVTLTF